jgi:AcrR family transcriptional regulator
VRHFTVDELAKRVGLSRVTIYRHFSSKNQVLDAVVLHELRKFMDEIEEVVDEYDSLEEKVVEGFVYALSLLRSHTLLQRLLRTEPELIVPLLTTQGAPIIDAGREFIAGFARGAAKDGQLGIDEDKLAILSEMLARLIVSVVLTPESAMKLRTEKEMRAFADEYVGTIVRVFSVAPNAG